MGGSKDCTSVRTGTRKRTAVRAAVAAAGIALLAAGAALGGYGDVLLKGVRVCLECIGLG